MEKEQPETKSTPFKRGAQRGNQNALKHGLYARRKSVPPPEAPPESSGDAPTRQRLSLASEIDFLRVQFRRLYVAGACCTKPDEVASVVRSMSMGAVAITRLIMTEDYLAQAAGSQVQYEELDQALQRYTEITKELHQLKTPPKQQPAPAPITDPTLEAMFPGIHQVAFECGISLDKIDRRTITDLFERTAGQIAAS